MQLVQFDRPGRLEVLRVVDAPVPEPGPEQVRVKQFRSPSRGERA